MKYLQFFALFLCLSLVACGEDEHPTIEVQRIGEFEASSLPDEMKVKNTVFIFAPQNCHKKASQRADA